MSDPKWMKYVRWPECSNCKSTGVAVDPKTQWPIECTRCRTARENAVKSAQGGVREDRKRGVL